MVSAPSGTPDSGPLLAELVRHEGARILATLVRTVGSWTVAEDAVQEAVLAALRTWPRTGIPEDPRAWLGVAARRKAIDILRREQARAGKERQAGALLMLRDQPLEQVPDSTVRDDQLRLIFTCCHPALSLGNQVALALRTLCGLSLAQTAAVLLVSESAMAKRLTRTRQKITVARIPYAVPGDADLPTRVTAVCGVVHALFTAGHAPLGGARVQDVDVCAEAARLARLVHQLMPDEAAPAAVLALILFSESRRPARTDANGDVVLLPVQDRSRWDGRLIAEAEALLAGSLRRTGGMADAYQLQAAIAAEHARAGSYADTDWDEVVRLFGLLLSVAPSPAAALARAVAVAERAGPAAGLAALAGLPEDHRLYAVRAELLARQGHFEPAVADGIRSLTGGLTEPERRFREARLRAWRERLDASPTDP
ncbi:MAG TPA: sigma-70 family RNA polymerase sigma factor [Dermatophilaceae bacterium]|nr:sigma-70 family RNA polymerase sigma factor [Dermatophilaceae bacterium]